MVRLGSRRTPLTMDGPSSAKKPKYKKLGCPLSVSLVSNVKAREKKKDGSVWSGFFRAPVCKSGTKRSFGFNVTGPRCSQN